MRKLLAIAALAAPLAANAADLGGHVLPAAPALPAVLAPATSWTGCYGGGTGGYAVSTSSLSAAYEGWEFWSVDDLAGKGATLGVIGGCDLQLNRVVVGAWGDYTWHIDHEAKTELLQAISLNGVLDTQWAVGGRAGVLLNDATLVYASLGYTEAEGADITAKGIVYGGGVEVQLGAGFAIRGEYRYSDLDEQNMKWIGDVEGLSGTADSDIHEVRAALTYRLGVGR
jgi:outer membrane immunogenic protein